MSDTDSFLDEVSEEVRKDKLFGYYKKYGWIAALGVVILVGGAAYFEYSKASKRTAAQERGDAIIAALENDAADARAAALNDVAADAGAASALVKMQSAAILADDGQVEQAATVLQSIAADADADQLYRDLANLKLVIMTGDTMDQTARTVLLDELSKPGAAFRPLALEQKAIAQIEAGETATAIETLSDLLSEVQVSANLRRRASQTIIALGGELPSGARLLPDGETSQ